MARLPCILNLRTVTPEVCLQTLREEQVLSVKHGYTEVPLAKDNIKEKSILSKDSYKANLWKMPSQFMDICSFQQKTSWYSPKAEDWGTPYADLVLMDHALPDKLSLVQYAWLCQLVVTRSLEVMIRRSGLVEGTWFLPMGLLKNGSVVAWPFDRIQVPGAATMYYFWPRKDPLHIDFRDLFHYLWEPTAWQATLIKWKSPLANFAGICRFPIHGVDSSCIIAFQLKQPGPLLDIVANEAFLDCDRSFMLRLCKYLGVQVPSSTADLLTLTELCVVKVIKKLADNDLVDILTKKLFRMGKQREVLLETFLDCDGAHACLNKEDAADFDKLGEQVATSAGEAEAYKKSWLVKANKVKGAVNPAETDLWLVPG